MASFVQPDHSSNLTMETCRESRFAVYCNSALPATERLKHWYQYLNLCLAVVAIAVPLIFCIMRFLQPLWQQLKERSRGFAAGWAGVIAKGIKITRGEFWATFRWSRAFYGGGSKICPCRLPAVCPGEALTAMSSFSTTKPDSAHSLQGRGISGSDRGWWFWIRSLANLGMSRSSIPDIHVTPAPAVFLRPEFLRSIKSFTFYNEKGLPFHSSPLQDYHLHITPLATPRKGNCSLLRSPSQPSLSHASSSKSVIGFVDLQNLDPHDLSEAAIINTARHLDKLRIENGSPALVLRISDSKCFLQVTNLLSIFNQQCVSIILMCDPDATILNSIDFGLLVGTIFENACILVNGHRRDFFRAVRLREMMGRCADERVVRPAFFVGFLDLWQSRPTAAVVRRAFKQAEYYEATLEHGPMTGCSLEDSPRGKLPMSLSGFDFLKRTEIIELQRSWLKETRKVYVNTDLESPPVAPLPLSQLQTILPMIEDLLTPCHLSEDLENIRAEMVQQIRPPGCMVHAPIRSDFWEFSSDGEQFSRLGCFPLTRGVSQRQYEAVLETQKHLKALHMLRALDNMEIVRLLGQLQALRRASRHRDLLDSLTNDISSHKVQIFKGLDTGFTLPGDIVHLWGLSCSSDRSPTGCIDIFVSQKAPSDVATVLHTYLAHHGVARVHRYEEELRLEQETEADSRYELPANLRSELAEATNAELLFLLEQLRISQLDHPFRDAMENICSSILIDESSRAAWTNAHSKGFLEGSISMQDLIQRRLEELARRGANKLPLINKLTELYHSVDQLIADALFRADRDTLNTISAALLVAYDPWKSWSQSQFVDINADLFALIFFCSLRKAAFEEVYLEATDRCPFFLTQPDQAAVFSELWVLGSQCEIYFGFQPLAMGEIIFNQHRRFLKRNPPPRDTWNGTDVLTAYSFTNTRNALKPIQVYDQDLRRRCWMYQTYWKLKGRLMEFGSLSIFCVPAILDVCLLTILGRGLFLTAFMGNEERQAACYALLASLLITAGVTGWVGSVGGFYLYSYAFDNMNYFLVQRLSGGFVLALLVSVCGFIAFALQYSLFVGFVFVAYLIILSTYLNLLGIMATMHRKGSPLKSGRIVLWRTFPLLFISPILSSFLNGHDLLIYLVVLYVFLFFLMFQYRKLCHEWSTWTSKVPVVREDDIIAWYLERLLTQYEGERSAATETDTTAIAKLARYTFLMEVKAFSRRTFRVPNSCESDDSLVAKVAAGLPLALWLLEKESAGAQLPELFTNTWFMKLNLALKNQHLLVQGLKEHNVFILFRYAQYDLGQNIGLFLISLMDHLVGVVMSAQQPRAGLYSEERSRYGISLCLLYLLMSAIAVDATLQNYWEGSSKLSNEKLIDFDHAQRVSQMWKAERRHRWVDGILELSSKLLFIFGFTTLLLWLLVDDYQQIIIYYAYIIGYTGVMVFQVSINNTHPLPPGGRPNNIDICPLDSQFNRCFTTSVPAHVLSILVSAMLGFVVGCLFHGLLATTAVRYVNALSLDIASLMGAVLSCIWVWKDPDSRSVPFASVTPEKDNSKIWSQRRLGVGDTPQVSYNHSTLANIVGIQIMSSDNSAVAQRVTELLWLAIQEPNVFSAETAWSRKLIEKTIERWVSGSIVITLVSRQSFMEARLQDSWAISEYENGLLRVTAGFLDETEVELFHGRWNQALAYMLTEVILHHTSKAFLHLSHRHAILAEHFLHETNTISKRIEFQLATENNDSLTSIIRKTNALLMKHLCLQIDVESQWDDVPEVVRRAVVARVVGKQAAITPEMTQWMATTSKNIELDDFGLALCLRIFHFGIQRQRSMQIGPQFNCVGFSEVPTQVQCEPLNGAITKPSVLLRCLRVIIRYIVSIVEWVAILSCAGSDIERELWYSLRGVYFHDTILRMLLLFWKICWSIRNIWIVTILIYNRPTLANMTRLALRGARRELLRNSITVELPRKVVTGFASKSGHGNITLEIFEGSLRERPADKKPIATAIYDEDFRLSSLQDHVPNGKVQSTYHYANAVRSRWPVSKTVVEPTRKLRCRYDKFGRVVSGTLTLGVEEFEFDYHYRMCPNRNDDILSADYRLAKSETQETLSVYWSVPAKRHSTGSYDWVPSERIAQIVRKIGDKKYITSWDYQHKRDPRISTVLEEGGRRNHVTNPPKVFDEEEQLIDRPTNLFFDADDLFIYHRSAQLERILSGTLRRQNPFTNMLPRVAGVAWPYWSRTVVYQKIPTWRLRTELWKLWVATGTLDAATACWMDELILRQEPLLQRYWRMRDTGRLRQAKSALDEGIDQIVLAMDITTEISQTCSLPIKPADLYTMGLGKDASQVTSRPDDCYRDTDDRISIIFNDIGCWPDAPGGVSNCRRDLVNGHSTIRNHVLAESANDYGIPRYQIERNVQSIKLLPLWGLDCKTAQHGIIDNLLQSQVDEKINNTDVQQDIVGVFIPLLTHFVKGARTKRHTRAGLISYSNILLDMSKYFEQKDYNKTWQSKEVERAWMEAWLRQYNDPTIVDPSEYFDIERPTMSEFREALNLYISYFFIYSVQIPGACPRVFQSTHHGISSLFGMVLKYRRGATFGIWDHAILWRESCLNISPAQSLLPISVQAMLLAGIGLAARLAYLHVDVILPCTSVFNPVWEAEIGTDQGRLGSKKLFSRKIDPIVNGINNMESFTPVETIRSDKPTVVMLSNVQFIKDIKTAVLAGDLIINSFGFEDYRLLVYGAQDRQPSYAVEVAKLISDRNLTGKVILAGFGSPKEVLKDAWVFMNSSLSEGLPLAIGEAALAGVPIVATEVGATALVLTDPDNSCRYGEVVPPNDPMSLARAQLSLLAMLGPWAKYTTDEAPTLALPDVIGPNDVKWITKRMYDKTGDRRKLGLMSRQVVLRCFHGDRYLREHEQMYWIQWHLAQIRANKDLSAQAMSLFRYGIPSALSYNEEDGRQSSIAVTGSGSYLTERGKDIDEGIMASSTYFRWQDFSEISRRSKNTHTRGRERTKGFQKLARNLMLKKRNSRSQLTSP